MDTMEQLRGEWIMKRIALYLLAAAVVLIASESVNAQMVWRTYRRPMVVYQPTTVVYTRNRPILGGTVVRTRPAYRRTVVW